jgi:hypothetical protein
VWTIHIAPILAGHFWRSGTMSACSKKHAPWYIIPSNHNWFRNLAVSQIIADTMSDMRLKLPEPTVDLAEIRKLYHGQVSHTAKGGKEAKRNKRTSE